MYPEFESEEGVGTCVLRSAADFVEMKCVRTLLVTALAVLAGRYWIEEIPDEAATRVAREREAARLAAFPVTTAPRGEFVSRAAGTDSRLHDLRHAHASYALRNQKSLQVAGRLLENRSAITTNRSVHLDDVTLSLAAERVAETIQQRCR